MNRRMSRVSVLAPFTLSLWIIGIAIAPVAPAEAQQPIRIGATMSETGAYSTQGVPARNGYLLCQKHVNEKGGILGRKIEFLIFDDRSDGKTAASLYEKLIVEDKVDAVMGPYGSPLTEAVAPVTEKHRKVMLTPLAATTSIWEQGRRYIFMQLAPSELFLAGLIDIGARNGLKTVALITEDTIFPKSAAKGTIDFAKKKGMDVVIHEEYAKGNKDFSAILAKVKAANPDVLGIASANLSDYIIVARRMKELDINVKMFGNTSAVAEFQQELGKTAEFAYGTSAWEPSLPYPGVKEFVEAYQKEFNKPPSFHAAGAYAGCQLFMEAARLAGSLDSDKLREQLLKLKTRTIFADYAVDARGFQTANKGLYVQWQDGKKVVVWPDELASAKPRFPTPPWSQR
jgi:branched-chain amino acid transport system substrate-binding protein